MPDKERAAAGTTGAGIALILVNRWYSLYLVLIRRLGKRQMQLESHLQLQSLCGIWANSSRPVETLQPSSETDMKNR